MATYATAVQFVDCYLTKRFIDIKNSMCPSMYLIVLNHSSMFSPFKFIHYVCSMPIYLYFTWIEFLSCRFVHKSESTEPLACVDNS